MKSAFLGAFQSAFVTDSVHHDFALGSEEIGGHDEHHAHRDEEAGFQPPGTVLHLQAIECDSGDEECGYKQHHTGIAETVKGLEELHRDLTHSFSAHSYGACSLAGQG